MRTVPSEFLAAYEKWEREQTIRNTRRGCALGALLVPLFAILDAWKYPQHAGSFFLMRLLCAGLMLAFLPVIGSALGRRHFRFLGLAILFMPTSAIAWMIYMTGEGATSPYYAGLILVLMFLGAVLEWTFWQSVASVILVWTLFLVACVLSPWPVKAPAEYLGLAVNNVAFLVSTGVVIIIGTYFSSKIRIREFVQRLEREKERRQMLANRIALLGEVNANFKQNINSSLVSITMFFDLLDEQPKTAELFDDDFLRQIRTDISKIKRQVVDLDAVATSHAESQKTSLLDINAALEEILQRQQLGFASRRISVESQLAAELPPLPARRMQIAKLFELLLDYEMSVLPAGSRIRLTTQMETLKGRPALCVTLADNGPALPAIMLQHMTDPTTKPPEPSEYGIKLVLCSLVVHNHGGTIEADNPAGGGNRFIIRLPLQTESELSAQNGT